MEQAQSGNRTESSPVELARLFMATYPEPSRLAWLYYEADSAATQARAEACALGSSEMPPDERERLLLFAALEAIEDYEYAFPLMNWMMGTQAPVEGEYPVCDDALLIIGTYLKKGLWTLEQAAPLLLAVLNAEAQTFDGHTRMLAAEAVQTFIKAQVAQRGEALGKAFVRRAIRSAGLPVECMEDPRGFWS